MKTTDTPVDGAPAAGDEYGRGVSWGVFLVVVVGVLCIGVALGFGASERLQQRELLWRWLLDRSERTVDDVAYRFGELWLKQLRLDANSPDYDASESRIRTQREQLEHLGRAMVDDEPAPATNLERGECNLYSDQWERLRVFDPYLLPNLRSEDGGRETEDHLRELHRIGGRLLLGRSRRRRALLRAHCAAVRRHPAQLRGACLGSEEWQRCRPCGVPRRAPKEPRICRASRVGAAACAPTCSSSGRPQPRQPRQPGARDGDRVQTAAPRSGADRPRTAVPDTRLPGPLRTVAVVAVRPVDGTDESGG